MDAAVLLLVGVSEFVYRWLKQYEPILLVVFQAKWPNRYIIKVTVVPHINNADAREAIELGGTFRVLRRDRVSSR